MNDSKNDSLAGFLAKVEFLSAFTEAERANIAEHAEVRHFDMGDNLAATGDPATHLLVIKKGSVRLFADEDGKELSVGVRKAGDVVAEIAALREHRHGHSVRASRKGELLSIPRETFEPLLAGNRKAREFLSSFVAIRSAGDFLIKLFDLRGKIEQAEINEIIGKIGIKRVRAGQAILTQGDKEDRRLYVVRQGSVQVTRNEDGEDYRIVTLNAGEVFGEKACLLRQEQAATASAVDDAVLLVIPQPTVRFILERNPTLREIFEERLQFFDRELERQKKVRERRRRPIMLDLQSQPKMGERVIKRFPLVHQAEEMDCGAACLAMICKHSRYSHDPGQAARDG